MTAASAGMHHTGFASCRDARVRMWPVRDSIDDNEISWWRRADCNTTPEPVAKWVKRLSPPCTTDMQPSG
jgi:hypothetical protein